MTPLVSVCIPTFNRQSRLAEAAGSVLSQTWTRLELVILDNASTDGTAAFTEELARRDARVRYVRRPANIGMVANFSDARDQARGDYFMWLSDDDRIEAGYIERCVTWLMSHEDYALACGQARYYDGEDWVLDDLLLNLSQRSPARRVLHWYYHMDWCGALFGVMRTDLARRAPFRNAWGCDNLFVAAMAFMGKVKTFGDISLCRQLGGVSRTAAQQAAAQGLPRFQGQHRFLSLATEAVRDVLYREPYRVRNPLYRAVLGGAAFVCIYLTRTRPAAWLYAFGAWLRQSRHHHKEVAPA